MERPNRFIAKVNVEGKTETVHVKNTGRCKELLIPGVKVVLEKAPEGSTRRTEYDLICVYKEGLGWVNIDSQVPNKVVKEWLESSPELFQGIKTIKPEYVYGSSRIDFYVECKSSRKILIEVKGCTLEKEGKGYFPDAPTERGVKHLHELTSAIKDGYESYLAFVIAMPEVTEVYPNMETHPEFGAALADAKKAGVRVINLTCEVTPDTINVKDTILA